MALSTDLIEAQSENTVLSAVESIFLFMTRNHPFLVVWDGT